MNRTNRCRLCKKQIDSRITMHKHIMNDHGLRERLDALMDENVAQEDTFEGR